MGSFTVLIEGSPAARVGDMTAHGGSIVPPGCVTCLIGDNGGGAGSPAVATMLAARASGAAFVRTDCATEAVVAAAKDAGLVLAANSLDGHFIEIELFDQKNRPVAHQRFRVVPPGDGAKPIEGFLDEKGFARISGIDAGTCRITFPDLDASSWKPDRGDPGKRTRPEPPPVPAGRPGVRATSVILEVALRPPSVNGASVQLVTVVVPPVTKPGVSAATVVLSVVGRPPQVQAASVTLKVVSGVGKFVTAHAQTNDADIAYDSQSKDPVGDDPNMFGDEGIV
jgi:hypothetical protein